ncbi:haloacid dehalogenase superfamily enzyme, subfamily IA [Desulfosporosinus acidiphilus SJ4]|uniref:Haloacid dehalogenase superfamily enzyme, subfamily IA n=1 Tax=Desulfosporosinus acidiphilus (strain DSM 22704 / JCM 16185 / SJ4) TaxID=646529 RepID=I4D2L1_DESAJ|nr:HAD family hydrolase [Desulfosporosinus acidiphilus]AFM40035.1 haloacid dehalogenase superfamily enzyme, subfamily IA [Desulfosporosinus acidiphilus SJ4]
MKLKGFIFDLDGTLTNTLPVCYIGFRKVLQKFLGREFTDQEITALLGPSEEGVFKKILPDNWEVCLKSYLDEYDKAHTEYAKPFPGIEEVLELLRQRGIKLAIVSGKGPGSMDISLRHSGLGQYFELVLTGSEQGADKPTHINEVLRIWNYSPLEVAYIGDTAYDIIAAKDVGTFSVGAVWANTAQVQKVMNEKPSVCFTDVDSFNNWIKQTT